MKLVKSIVIALYIFLAAFCANSCLADDFKFHPKTDYTISSHGIYENDILNTKDNDCCIETLTTRNTSSLLNNKKHNQGFGTNSQNAALILNQRKALEEYIYHQSYPNNKRKIALSTFLVQIQPNAP